MTCACDVERDPAGNREASPWPFGQQRRRAEPGQGTRTHEKRVVVRKSQEPRNASDADDGDDGGDDDDGHGPGNSNPAHSASTESLDRHDNLRQLIPLMTMVLT